jgi:pyruvate formate lyase activating enzyme
MQGIIFDIKHFAIHDGPGIRQTIFLKGCPLSCWWCHNPESRSKEIVAYKKTEKIGNKSVEKEDFAGRKVSLAEVMKEIEKDRVFFEESGGGVTFSGGEPFLQFEFLMALLKSCNGKNIHTCIDTTGYTSREKIEEASKHTDLFLYDLKHMDDAAHIKYTGVSNKPILENLLLLDQFDKAIQIRLPLIPGLNDDESNIFRTIDFVQKLKKKHPVSLLPYHKIGKHKYCRFGIEYKMEGVDEPSKEYVEKIKSSFKEAGFTVTVSG